MKESQLTFSDIASTGNNELYPIITELASALTESNRNRSGDNCPTVTRASSDSQHPEFSVKLPPKTTDLSLEEVPSNYSVEVRSFSRSKTDNDLFVFVATTLVQEKSLTDSIILHFVFPAEEPAETNETEDAEVKRNVYEQFDFKKFMDEFSSTED